MSQLQDWISGTIHVIVNNKIGFDDAVLGGCALDDLLHGCGENDRGADFST